MNIVDRIMQAKENSARKVVWYFPDWVTPNILTLWRVLFLVPIIFFILQEKFFWVWVFFLLGVLMDYFDGPLARSRGQVSDFGKLFDPSADKVLFLVVVFLVGWVRLEHWLLWTVFGMEAFLAVLVLVLKPILAKIKKERKAGANIFGKLKMVLQSLAMIILLLGPNNPGFVVMCEWLLVASLPFSLGSILGHLLGKPVREKD